MQPGEPSPPPADGAQPVENLPAPSPAPAVVAESTAPSPAAAAEPGQAGAGFTIGLWLAFQFRN